MQNAETCAQPMYLCALCVYILLRFWSQPLVRIYVGNIIIYFVYRQSLPNNNNNNDNDDYDDNHNNEIKLLCFFFFYIFWFIHIESASEAVNELHKRKSEWRNEQTNERVRVWACEWVYAKAAIIITPIVIRTADFYLYI